MSQWLSSLDNFMLIGLPYAALILLIVGFVHRYRHHNAELGTLSTQFLENRQHFWGLVPLHYGILAALLVHAICFLLPDLVIWWDADRIRLYSLEELMLTAGLLALFGLAVGIQRRRTSNRVRRVTRLLDWVVLGDLGFQVVTGILVAVLHPWGTGWLAAAGAPYLRSVLLLSPDPSPVADAPLLIKLHIGNAFVLVALVAYTRLSHVLLIPVSYLWRPLVIFRWAAKERGRARD